MYGTSGVNARYGASVRASNIETLLSLWTKDRRAKGGWWALAGFSYQSALYLFRFFQQLQNSAKSPAELAKTELLSDILVPKDGLFTLIQVKRTLDRPRLAAALREAYEIAKLCNADLLAKLSFKIACIECTTRARPKDFAAEEVGGDSVDIELWTRLLGCFNENDAIIEEPDPLDHLYDFLWHMGIRDAAGFVDNCLGLLLRLFADPSQEAISQLAWELTHAFNAARSSGHGPIKRIGLALERKDVELTPEASADRGILFDRRPQLRDLQLGRLRERRTIFADLIKTFEPWWRKIIAADEASNVSVFWIEGRSGEGKSVLLLQLVQRILTDTHPPVLSYLSSADELPDWIENQRDIQRGQANPGWLPAVAVVDDLHFIRDREEWETRLRAATNLISPRVAVLACGTTLEREKFQSEFSTIFHILHFPIPNLERQEMEAFRNWFVERTNQRVDLHASDVANRMLVIWIFELLRGESIREFAGNFKRRLVALDLFDLALAILAINALELPAPAKLVESMSDSQRDAFQALCSASQLHFEKIENALESLEGYRLSHPQIDWQLYREWASPPATLAQHWGRDLAHSLVIEANASNASLANTLVFRLGTSLKLSEGGVDALHVGAGTINQALSELYRKQSTELSLNKAMAILPRWLEVTFRGLTKTLDPDPVQLAVDLASHETQPNELPPAVSAWLWRLSEVDEYKLKRAELRAAAQSVVFGALQKPGVGGALNVIASKSTDREAALDLCNRWLDANPTHQEAYRLLTALVAAHPADDKVVGVALKWVEDNPTHQQAYELLSALVAAHPADDKVVGLALKWIEENPTHQEAYMLLAPLVARRPSDNKVVSGAITWVKNNPTQQDVHYLLAALVSARGTDDNVMRTALNWVEDNTTNQQTYNILGALVAARPADHKVVGVALKWVEDHPRHQQAYELIKALVAARPADDKVVGVALKWVEDNPRHQQAYQLLSALVAACPADHKVVGVALKWVEDNQTHQQAYELIRALVAARPADDKVVGVALKWMEGNETHQQAYELIRALVAARPADDKVVGVALKWVEDNPTHQQTYQLLSAMVAARPTNDKVVGVGRTWLDKNPNHPQAYNLLATLITRSNGADEWMQKGKEAFLNAIGGAKRNLLVALLAGSKANQNYVELTLDAVQAEADGGNKAFLLGSLGRSLANNLQSALLFLAGQSTPEHRRLAAQALARALRTYPNRALEFLDLRHTSPAEYTGLLLSACISSEVSGDALNTILRGWLNDHQYAKGYGAVLRALKQHPDRWQALKEFGGLSVAVQIDYGRL